MTAQPEKRPRGCPKGAKRLNPDLVYRAIQEAEGILRVAADVLGVTVNTLQQRIDRDPRLAALMSEFRKVETVQVTELESMTRSQTDIPPPVAFAPAPVAGDAMLAEMVRKQDDELVIKGLEKVGIGSAMLDKLRNISALGSSPGQFMATSLGLTHKLMVVQTIELAEEAEYIKANYLRNGDLTCEERSYWQKCYNEIADLIGKGFDRTLAGTQALIAMQRGAAGVQKKMKPGPQPLNSKPDIPI